MKTIDKNAVLIKHLPKELLSPTLSHCIGLALNALEKGNLCIDIDDEISKQLQMDFEAGHPFFRLEEFASGTKFYLQKFNEVEKSIFNKLKTLMHKESENLRNRRNFLLQHKEFIQSELFSNYEEGKSGTAIDWQKVAALNAFTRNFAIITGGPGTGKTTTVAKLLYLLYKETDVKNITIELAAQTGKAAVRLKESLMASTEDKIYGIGNLDQLILQKYSSILPKTIHRLLGSIPNNVNFKHNKDNPILADVVIIDEASMVDAPLMAKLMEAIRPDTRLYLLGDRNQLTSVEVGSVFSDLCLYKLDATQDLSALTDKDFYSNFLSESENEAFQNFELKETKGLGIDNMVELKRSYRFDDTQQIGVLAKDIIANTEGHAIDISAYTQGVGKEVQIMDPATSNLSSIYKGFEAYINESEVEKALHKLNDVKILCALRSHSTYGTTAYNLAVERYLVQRKLLVVDNGFYHNQPIIVTANDYYLELYNGDVGLIRKNKNGELRAYFESVSEDGKSKKIRSVLPASIQACETAFAISIHKSQGSEFDTILMVLPTDSDHKILTRELVYTGLTRAKKQVYILSEEDVLLTAIKQPVRRISGLGNRLNQA